MSIKRIISAYRWPIILASLLLMSVSAQGVLVYVATRPDAPRPIADYYERSLEWDADLALLAASRRLGWSVHVEIPAGEEYTVTARRPVDITVQDREGQPVTELTGRLVAVRPADIRLNGKSELVELPHDPGHYRTLARLPVTGLWELSLDTHRGETRFLHTERVMVTGAETP
jgi:nitrogen fixation protein FixH